VRLRGASGNALADARPDMPASAAPGAAQDRSPAG